MDLFFTNVLETAMSTLDTPLTFSIMPGITDNGMASANPCEPFYLSHISHDCLHSRIDYMSHQQHTCPGRYNTSFHEGKFHCQTLFFHLNRLYEAGIKPAISRFMNQASWALDASQHIHCHFSSGPLQMAYLDPIHICCILFLSATVCTVLFCSLYS